MRVGYGILSPMCLDCMKGHPHGIKTHIPFNQESGTVNYSLRSDRPFQITNILTWSANCVIEDITIHNCTQMIPGGVPGQMFNSPVNIAKLNGWLTDFTEEAYYTMHARPQLMLSSLDIAQELNMTITGKLSDLVFWGHRILESPLN